MNFTPHKPYDFIRVKNLEATKAFSFEQRGILVSTGFKKEILISWKLPPEGWLKLNIDGVVGSNGNKLSFLLYFFLSHIELGKKEKMVLILLLLLVLVE